ncbi:unnamed protein product [Caenorhabditis angaria]|uniref:Serine/arginine-rich splicing factor 2 n=1 Tax=Caenorhabditis angaria TaxID=860376 RepID=A0A9P1I7E4_9PELO|nr:unnamed protein product [Caenorhabditis angaria]
MSRGERRAAPAIEGLISIKVDNLSYNTSAQDLRRLFDKYGEIGDVHIPRDKYSKQSRGFGFVRFHDKRDAEYAAQRCDGKHVDGRELRVTVAKYDRPPPNGDNNRDRGDRDRRRSRSPRGGRGNRRSRSPRRRQSPPRRRSRSPPTRRRSRTRSPPGRSPSRSRSPSRERREESRSRSRSRSASRSPSASPQRAASSRSPSKSRSRSP